MDHIKLVKDRIDINHIQTLLVDESCGACSLFVGTTRDNFEGKRVISLEYESYETMALKEMTKICNELRARWPDLKHIVIYHRLGTVPVKEESVVIAASSPHRATALVSVSFAVDQLKSRVPIWKKEIYEEDLIGKWKENVECSWPQKLKKTSRTFDFFSCKIDKKIENIPDKLVQIGVSDNELKRRVKCFLKIKRDEINLHNIDDFVQQTSYETYLDNAKSPTKFSCARTQSCHIKQQQTNGHLKVRRAMNSCGPQERPNYSFQLNKLMTSHINKDEKAKNSPVNDRLQNIEAYMYVIPDEGNILNRIKYVENRILLLESFSPEYKYFIQSGMDFDQKCVRKPKKRTHLSNRLSESINKIKSEINMCEK